MDALALYGKDNLFHNILKQSAVFKGHYFISAANGLDINSNNFDSVDQDWTKKQYPLVICMVPKSTENTTLPTHFETLVFTMVFLKQTYIDEGSSTTRKSIIDSWVDCEDMVKAARNFMRVYARVISKSKTLREQVSIVQGDIDITRVTRISSDRASGAVLVFKLQLKNNDCVDTSSDAEYPAEIVTPTI